MIFIGFFYCLMAALCVVSLVGLHNIDKPDE